MWALAGAQCGHSPTEPWAAAWAGTPICGAMTGLLTGGGGTALAEMSSPFTSIVLGASAESLAFSCACVLPAESCSASHPVTGTSGDAGGPVLERTVQSRATQNVLFKQLQLFYETILGFNAAGAGW